MQKLEYQYVKNFIEEKGYVLLSEKYSSNTSDIVVKDAKGFLYSTSFVSIQKCNSLRIFDIDNKFTIKNIIHYLLINNIDLKLIDEKYVAYDSKMTFVDSDGYYYCFKPSNLLEDKHPLKFHFSNIYTFLNIETFLRKNFSDINFVYNQRPYVSRFDKMNFIDNLGYKYIATMNNLLANKHPRRFCKTNPFTFENIKNWININNKNFEIISGEYLSSDKYLEFFCKICKKPFFSTWENIYANKGCPFCKMSKGERKIQEYLEKSNIDYEYQYSFDKCRNKRKLEFDFYLPKYNCCIEFHGQQHYEASEFFGGKQYLQDCQKRDKIKESYCIDNKIDIVIIPYFFFDNIHEILDKIIR
jgi:hypothetical protein